MRGGTPPLGAAARPPVVALPVHIGARMWGSSRKAQAHPLLQLLWLHRRSYALRNPVF